MLDEEKMMERLADIKIKEKEDEYIKLCDSITPRNNGKILDILEKNNNSNDVLKTLLCILVRRVFSNENGGNTELFLRKLREFLRKIEKCEVVYFVLLESVKKFGDTTLVEEILNDMGRIKINCGFLLDLLEKPGMDGIILQILGENPDLIEEFIRESLQNDSTVAGKNVASVLPRLPIEYFLEYTKFKFMFGNEKHVIRCCAVEIFGCLIEYYKEKNEIEKIEDITISLGEQIVDTNLYVRSKVLNVIGVLFEKECILKEIRNRMIEGIIGRIMDKSVIVRKKAVSLLTQIMVNHPFKTFKCLNVEVVDRRSKSKVPERMRNDFVEFVEMMSKGIERAVSVLEYDLKSDYGEIIEFIKNGYILYVNGAQEGLKKLLTLVFGGSKEILVDAFREIVCKREEVLHEFQNDRGFEEILRGLSINEKPLYTNFYRGTREYESLYLLEVLAKPVEEEEGMQLLMRMSNMLFRSSTKEELERNIDLYGLILGILGNIRKRMGVENEILRRVSINIVKMKFFEKKVVRKTVEMIYKTSLNPDENSRRIVMEIARSGNVIKLVECIGWISLYQCAMLERIERRMQDGEIREIGLCLEDGGEIRKRRESIEEERRRSLGVFPDIRKMSLRFDELNNLMREKTNEEIADVFFYLKEEELLYSEKSLLGQFGTLVDEIVGNGMECPEEGKWCDEMIVVGHRTMISFMQVSSRYFKEHKKMYLESLHHRLIEVRENAIFAFHSFMILYSSEIKSEMLFELLCENEIRKSVFFVVVSLVYEKIIKIKNNSEKIVRYLEDEVIGESVKAFLHSFQENQNIISMIFLEIALGTLSVEYLRYVTRMVDKSLHEQLFLKCLEREIEKSRLRCIYEMFVLSENFVKENKFREDLRRLLDDN